MSRWTGAWWVVVALWEILVLAAATTKDNSSLASWGLGLLFGTIIFMIIWLNAVLETDPADEETHT